MLGFLKTNLPILIIILILFSYLGIKALDENGWDGWGFGSAQTLMSSEYWAKDGFAKNYFLFIPYPYSKQIHYLDELEFRNRLADKLSGELPRNRLYYTHYPPLYLVPYALLSKIGFTSRFIFRILALIISLGGLIFFYWFIKLVSNKTIAIIATIYYGFSITFLNYADSLANQPFTIFFTFLILVLSILAGRLPAQRRYNLAIWIAYLALSLSSYDATIFVFAWLILYDIAVLKKFLWWKWLFWVSAPILGFLLQILQNAWYLGWTDTMRDIYISYTGRAIGSARNFIVGLIMPLVSMTSLQTIFIFKKTIIALTSAAVLFGILWKFRRRIGLDFNYFKIILILAVAAVVQPFFINVTGHWPYQGVLTAPFWGLLIGTAGVFVINTVKKKELNIYKTFYFWILAATVSILWWTQFYSTFVYAKDWPNNKPDQKVIEFSKVIKTIETGSERMAFRIIPQNLIWKSQFPTFNMEYYMGMPTIDFANTNDLLADFWWLRNRSEYPFYSFIIAENKKGLEKIRRELLAKNVKSISPIVEIQNQYLFTVGTK